MDAEVLRLALGFVSELRQRHADYKAECEEYRRRGLRPQACEHGTDQWTSYDNICGGCEDGWSLGNPLHLRQAALGMARTEVENRYLRGVARRLRIAKDAGNHVTVEAVLREVSPSQLRRVSAFMYEVAA